LRALVDGVDHIHVGQVVEVVDAQALLGLGDTVLEDGDGPGLLVDLEMLVLDEAPDQGVDLVVDLRGIVGRTGDDEGGAGLVDEDRVDLVDDGEVEGRWTRSDRRNFMLSRR